MPRVKKSALAPGPTGRRPLFWGGVGFLLLSSIYVAWRVFGPNPLVAEAAKFAVGLRYGDADQLIRATIGEERECSNLNRESIRQAWDILIRPQILDSKYVGPLRSTLASNRVQATAGFRFLDRKGNPWAISSIANQAGGEPKMTVLYTMLATASRFDDNGLASEPNLTTTLSLNGLRRYRPKLDAIGIHRVMLSPGRCVSWDELDGILSKSIQLEEKFKAGK